MSVTNYTVLFHCQPSCVSPHLMRHISSRQHVMSSAFIIKVKLSESALTDLAIPMGGGPLSNPFCYYVSACSLNSSGAIFSAYVVHARIFPK